MGVNVLFSKKTIFVLAGVIAAYTLTGFFLLPVLTQNILEDKLSQAFNRSVVIKKIALNPYTLSMTMNGVTIEGKESGTLFSAQKLYGNVSLSSVFAMSLVVSDIVIDSPYVNIIRNLDDSFNFSDLTHEQNQSSPSSSQKNDENIFSFNLKKIVINQGKIQFTDKVKKASHLVERLSVSLMSLTSKRNKKDEKTTADLHFVLNNTPVELHIVSTPFAEDLATHATITTQNIDVLHYISYLSLPSTVVLQDLDLNVDVSADFIRKNNKQTLMISGAATALNVHIKNDQNEDLFKVPSLAVEFFPSSVLDGQVDIAKMTLDDLEIHLERDKTGGLNLLKHLPKTEQKTQKKVDVNDKGTAFVLTLKEFQMNNGALFFTDTSNKTPFETRILPLNLRISNTKVHDSISGEYELDLHTRQKEKLFSIGRFDLFPLKVSGTIDLTDGALNHYMPYLENWVGFFLKKGRLNLNCNFDLSQKNDQLDLVIKNENLLIQDLNIYEDTSEKELLSIPEFKMAGSVIDVGNKTIDTGIISSSRGRVRVKRLENGLINLVKSSMVEPPDMPVDPKAKTIDIKSNDPVWALNVNQVDIKDYDVIFNDFINKDPVEINLSKVQLSVRNFKIPGSEKRSSEKGSIDAKMNWNKNGSIHISGGVNPENLSADLNFDLIKVDIESLQPYFTDNVKIIVTNGDINTNGRLIMRLDQSENQLQFNGHASITDFVSLDKKRGGDFFKCKSLYFSDLKLSGLPVVVNTKDISLTDFYSRIIVNDNGEINLATIYEKESPPSSAVAPVKEIEKPPAQNPQIIISNVTLQGGDINFSDQFTKPNFTASMKQIAGSINGLSSEPSSRAKIHLKGIHGDFSPLEIMGSINPLAQKKFVDINISYKDIELTNFTPYSSKYLGYKIAKGKLILDLEYRVDGKSLKSQNRARFDNFDLGEPVDSEHATSLPVSLAVSLLKDRNGQINLDLPVTGNLDDPEFSFGSIILKMISNLILKAATSPFSILGALFGGGEELGYVEFKFGETSIDPVNFDKMDKLIEILEEKSKIKLEIQGMYDPIHDADALRKKGFMDLIKAEKLQDMMKSGKTFGALDQIQLSEKEMEPLINRAYAKSKFPKPRDSSGAEKKIEPDEKTKLLQTNIKVKKDDLRLLAMKRSQEIKAYILSKEKIETERVFLREPVEEESSQTRTGSRVQFSLK